MMHFLILFTLLIPCLCALFLATKSIFQKKEINESFISHMVETSFVLYLLGAISTTIFWITLGCEPYRWVYDSIFSLYLDWPAIVYLCITALITNVILFYSRRYLHRDPGYQRFFMVLSAFVTGLTLVIFAGNFELIFAGWEVVGLSSFLLIGFYWHRPQAALNANRAYYIYRICDLGLLVGAFISHMQPNLEHRWALSLMILLTVIGKSAQFPFCYWLPRVMEGPTPSSAIFYGSLSIHAGVFLLLRTFDIWFNTPGFVWVVGSIGLCTAIFATVCGRVQANIKGQVGYASIAQVGIMLIELACGFPTLALIHMTGNAFLRCFQLLVSPSIVTQQLQIHSTLSGQYFEKKQKTKNYLQRRFENTLYVIAINEFYFPSFFSHRIVRPIYTLAKRVNQLEHRATQSRVLAPALMISIAPLTLLAPLPYLVLGFSFFVALTALGENKSPLRALHAATLSNVLVAIAVWFQHRTAILTALLYLTGLLVSWILATESLNTILKRRTIQSITHFSGLFAQFPLASSLFLLGVLGVIGFPLSVTFWCEDQLIDHAISSGWLFLVVFNSSFILNGITLVRLYSHLFWGKRDNQIPGVNLDFSSNQVFARIFIFLIINAAQLSAVLLYD